MKSSTKFIVGIILILIGGAVVVAVPLLATSSNNTLFPGFFLMIIGAYLAGIEGPLRSLFPASLKASQEKEINEIRERTVKEPDSLEPVWDLGRAKLELYFDRNLNQISWIFVLSVIVMIIGFIFILYGISQTFISTLSQTSKGSINIVTPALISAVSGIITEFIGATFLFLYRSTIQQASGYIKTLERINSVGMGVKILETISKDAVKLQDETKAEIVKMLLKSGTDFVPEIEKPLQARGRKGTTAKGNKPVSDIQDNEQSDTK